MSITTATLVLLPLLRFAVPLVFCLAFFLWWRRLGHWSFALLSTAAALDVISQVCGFLATNIPRFGLTESEAKNAQSIWTLVQVSLVLDLIFVVLLLIGGFGLIFAAKDDFLLDDAKKRATDAA